MVTKIETLTKIWKGMHYVIIMKIIKYHSILLIIYTRTNPLKDQFVHDLPQSAAIFGHKPLPYTIEPSHNEKQDCFHQGYLPNSEIITFTRLFFVSQNSKHPSPVQNSTYFSSSDTPPIPFPPASPYGKKFHADRQ